MNKEEFIKMIDISQVADHVDENGNQLYGHYPFSIVAMTEDNNMTVGALALNDVVMCYFTFAGEIVKGAKTVYMSIDFPPMFEIETDFVAIHEYIDGKSSVVALPYNPQTGELHEIVTEGRAIELLTEQFVAVTKDDKGMMNLVNDVEEQEGDSNCPICNRDMDMIFDACSECGFNPYSED